jgi:hypothetical protein
MLEDFVMFESTVRTVRHLSYIKSVNFYTSTLALVGSCVTAHANPSKLRLQMRRPIAAFRTSKTFTVSATPAELVRCNRKKVTLLFLLAIDVLELLQHFWYSK